MKRRFHLPALGGLLTTLGGLAAAIVAVPQLADTTAGKVAAVVVAIGSLWQSVTKPLPKGKG